MERYQILPLLGLVDGDGYPVLTSRVLDCLAAAGDLVEAVHPAIEAMATLFTDDGATGHVA